MLVGRLLEGVEPGPVCREPVRRIPKQRNLRVREHVARDQHIVHHEGGVPGHVGSVPDERDGRSPRQGVGLLRKCCRRGQEREVVAGAT